MQKSDRRILRSRKRKLAKRLARRQWSEQARPMPRARNIQYELAERTRAIDCGGLGAARIPDPTTAGDFTQRFEEADVLALQEAINRGDGVRS